MKKITIFLFFLFFIAGCQVAPFISPIITGIIIWSEGEANKYYNEDFTIIKDSTKRALKQLNIVISKEEPTKNGYSIVCSSDRFKISIQQVKPHITKVSIRINFMGDKPYAELVYKTIDANTDTIEFDNGKPFKVRR